MGSSAGIRICVSSQALYTARDAKTESININPELSRGPDGGNVSTQYRGSGACLEHNVILMTTGPGWQSVRPVIIGGLREESGGSEILGG